MSTELREQLQTSLGSDLVIQRELGGGGMSRVFLADEVRLGRKIVVKVLNPDLGSALLTERFEREIRLAARLQDPRIVPLLQAGRVGDLPYFTMPYVEGESLRARLNRTPLSTDEALAVLRDMALALEYAHGQHIVHRDIKPENILLSGRTALVADFGIAKAISDATLGGTGGVLTSMGTIVGTPAYIAPEQASGDPVDARTDLYAWGVIAYELLSGAHPFATHTTAQAILAAHISETPSSLAARRPDLPLQLTSLVDSCLSKDPAKRPLNASAVLAQLTPPVRPATAHRLTPVQRLAAVVLVLVLAGGATWAYLRSEHQRWARVDAPGEIARLNAADQPLAAFQLLQKAQRYLPADSALARTAATQTALISVASSPPGATVEIKDYLTPDAPWYTLGVTPIAKMRLPNEAFFRWRISKPGVGEYVVARLSREEMRFPLDSALQAPEGMLRVGAGNWGDMIAFVGWVGPFNLPAFYIDRYEVTNRQYQEFIDRGGYRDKKYWHERFEENGREISWDDAMARFRDRTRRAGPSTWEGGHFPEGQAEYPVSGVSWYEAAAYAEYAGKSLPAFAQWFRAAPARPASFTARMSNMAGKGAAPVGTFQGLGTYGTFDMAGNVREWTANALGADRRFILGGMWDSQTYLYADPEAFSSFDRSAGNGIRCVKNVTPLPPDVLRPVKPLERDFTKHRVATDDVFRAYRQLYAYAKTPLDARAEGVVEDTKDWREEKVSFAAAYGGERLSAYLFLPKNVQPPFQTVVFFPSARVLDIPSSKTLGDIEFFDYVVQSGRAVLYPVYQDTYERRVQRTMPGASSAVDVVAQRAKDFGRSIDYLLTRPDIAKDKLGYIGVSMGAAEGVIYTTLEQERLKVAVLLDGGYFLYDPPVGVDQADFAPRLTLPVLMVNGRFDFTFSLERAQAPLFAMLGTPAADKRHAVLETPHDVTADRPNLVKEVLAWLDKYLGSVN
ncbi:MAG: bifunctional serine/threonine-protein kinase/formylglycine-generating enzyme family protein [Gemmatimonadaceae bacterium]